jgi:hypothetical protein
LAKAAESSGDCVVGCATGLALARTGHLARFRTTVGRYGRVASGPNRKRAALCSGPGPINLFNNQSIFQLHSNDQASKIQKGHLLGSKNFQTLPGVGKFNKNNFPFGKGFKFPTEFELKI